MKTTLVLDDAIVAKLKREAARQRRSMSELVESALRLMFREPAEQPKLPRLPLFSSGGLLVDVADRAALSEVLDREHDEPLHRARKKK